MSQSNTMTLERSNDDRYQTRRGEIETYFDRTAVDAWARLTSTAPVGRVRATVRAGRDTMRATLLSWLPEDLSGRRLLDAGCGTGALAVEAARRGAHVVAIDLSPTLVNLAAERMPKDLKGSVDWHSGDMLDLKLGHFDHIVCMDSVIHYQTDDAAKALAKLAERTSRSIAFTIAPGNPVLNTMLKIGQWFPRGDRSPSIVPTSPFDLGRKLTSFESFAGWKVERSQRVSSGFYKSHAMELVAP